MGMTHDGEDENSCDGSSYLMSPSLHPKTGRPKTSWSTCSRSQLHNFLRSPQSICLENNAIPPTHLDFATSEVLPGDNFSPDQQCQMLCGKNCKAYSTQKPRVSSFVRFSFFFCHICKVRFEKMMIPFDNVLLLFLNTF